ncbi:MAG: PDGLE domain-containing protein [Methanomicrobiaceae archaeon]|nr:PDGLE domain-containing protein [Methanomicrobiaceae archaeon]
MMEIRQLVIAGVALALVIGVAAVFFASGDPDGLESTALFVQGEKTLTGDSPEEGDPEAIGAGTFEYEAPMPDYTLGEDAGKPGEVMAIIAGIVISLVGVFAIARVASAGKA